MECHDRRHFNASEYGSAPGRGWRGRSLEGSQLDHVFIADTYMAHEALREDNYGPYGPEWGTCPDEPMQWAIEGAKQAAIK